MVASYRKVGDHYYTIVYDVRSNPVNLKQVTIEKADKDAKAIAYQKAEKLRKAGFNSSVIEETNSRNKVWVEHLYLVLARKESRTLEEVNHEATGILGVRPKRYLTNI